MKYLFNITDSSSVHWWRCKPIARRLFVTKICYFKRGNYWQKWPKWWNTCTYLPKLFFRHDTLSTLALVTVLWRCNWYYSYIWWNRYLHNGNSITRETCEAYLYDTFYPSGMPDLYNSLHNKNVFKYLQSVKKKIKTRLLSKILMIDNTTWYPAGIFFIENFIAAALQFKLFVSFLNSTY